MVEMIDSILVHVHTTKDDKDKEITFEFAILDDLKPNDIKNLGSVRVGGGELWDNGDQRDIKVKLATPFPLPERRRLSLAHIYSSSHGNPGWEGRISAHAQLVSGDFRIVLRETGDFKLGEHNNPTRRDFHFNE